MHCLLRPVDNNLTYAVRKCSKFLNGSSYWLPVNASACLERGALDASNRLRDLMTMTSDAAHLSSDEVANITATLEDVFAYALLDENIAKSMVCVVGNLLEANKSVLVESNSKSNCSARLVLLLEQYTSNAVVNGNITISTENIHLMALDYGSDAIGQEVIYQPAFSQPNATKQDDILFKLPHEILPTTEEDSLRLQFMLLRSSAFFIPANESMPREDTVHKQRVLSASVKGKQLTDLTMPVSYRITNILPNDNHICVYWNKKVENWSNSGMVTKSTGGNFTECLSYHLTSFAVLLDPSPTYILSTEHERILTYISYIGCVVSMAGLLFTTLTYSLFKCLNRDKSSRILLNLCVAMLMLNVIFVVGSESSESSEQICMTVSILLHYFLLATLMWMCMEAINMYQVLVTVFTKYSGYFMLKRCLAAWGLPVVVIAITAGVNVDHYRPNSKFCFISHASLLAYYISVVAPACLILVINTVVFIMVARVILKPRFRGQVGSTNQVTPAQIRGAFAVMILLGVTWVFGPFAVNEAKLVFNYIFCVLNSLQGFLIFIFRCLFNPEARMAWVLLIKSGQLKRRKGPIKSISDMSSKADTKLNGSFVDTNSAKTNVFSNVGWQRNKNYLTNEKNMPDNKRRFQNEFHVSNDGMRNEDNETNKRNALFAKNARKGSCNIVDFTKL